MRHTTWRRAAPRLTAIGLLALGVGLATLGVVLTASAVSAFDMIAGTGLVATALLLRRSLASALLVYAVVILAGMGVSVWQHGLEFASLVPNANMLAPIGVWLLTPWVTRGLTVQDRRPKIALAAAVVIALATIGAAAVCAPNQMDDSSAIALAHTGLAHAA